MRLELLSYISQYFWYSIQEKVKDFSAITVLLALWESKSGDSGGHFSIQHFFSNLDTQSRESGGRLSYYHTFPLLWEPPDVPWVSLSID